MELAVIEEERRRMESCRALGPSLRPFILILLLGDRDRSPGPGHINTLYHGRLEIIRLILISSDFPDQHLHSQRFFFPLGEIMGLWVGSLQGLRRGVDEIETPDGIAIPDISASPAINMFNTDDPVYVPVPMSFDHLDLQRIIADLLSRKQAEYEK